MKKFFIHTFGCQMNVYDSERVALMLSNNGWTYTEDPSNAELIIINSCSVRDKPLQKLFSCTGRYLPYKKKNGTKIFVMGCVAQQLGEKMLEKASYIDGVFGPGAEDIIPEIAERGIFPFVSNDVDRLKREEIFPESSKGSFFENYSSGITVMHGCNNYCSYCIVPFVRGPEISRKADSIIEEIKTLVSEGVVEISLLGQNVNSYKDPATGMDFSDLLYSVAKNTELKRLRFMTSHPKDFGEKLAKTFRDIPQLMPHLHLPAQSGSSRILNQMNRKYTIDEYLSKIDTARKYCPDIALSSDFIVGFPDETDDDFEQTLNLVNLIGYDVIYAFAYSPRPFTRASNLTDSISLKLKAERLNQLLDLQKKRMKNVRKRYLERIVEVLIENESPKSNSLMGRNEHNLVTHVLGAVENDKGKIIKVKITEILENTLRGEKI